MSLQEEPTDQSVGPKRDEMHQRAAVLVDQKLIVTEDDKVLAARYIRRWAVKNDVKGEPDGYQNVLDALGLI